MTYAQRQVLVGALVAHALWALFFVTGSVFDTALERPSSQGRSMLRVVAYTLAGIAIWCFEAFVLGSLHALDRGGLAVAACANALALYVVGRRAIAQRRFWARRVGLVRDALRGPGLLVYLAALVLCTPASIPDFSSDGVRVHLANAYEWFRAQRIYAEPRMRFPYYAFNSELTYAVLMVLGAGRYIPFFGWLTGTLACLGIEGLIAGVDDAAQRARTRVPALVASAVAVLLPLSFMLSAVFLRWWPTAMTDAFASAAFLVTVASLVMLAIEGDGAWLLIGALVCAFLAGMKPSYLFFTPFVGAALAFAAHRRGWSRGAILALLAMLFIGASPWYVRNLVRDGDPIPPVFNLALRGHDPNFSQADWDAIVADLHTKRTIAQWERFPLDEFEDPQTIVFREYGVTAVVLTVYLFPIAVVLLLLQRRRSPGERALLVLVAGTVLGIVYVMATSALTRYTMIVYPEVAAAAGLVFLRFGFTTTLGTIVALVASALCVLPSPGSKPFYVQFRGLYYSQLSAFMPSDDVVLGRLIPGYAEAAPMLGSGAHTAAPFHNVMLVEAPIQYYVELHGAQPWGDWSGPGRYRDIARAIDAGTLAAYVREHDIGAAVVKRVGSPILPEEAEFMREQLLADGFVEYPSSDAYFYVFARRAALNKRKAAAR